MGGGKGGGSQTVTQKSDPWAGIQPQLLQAAKDTQKLYNTGALNQQYFPGQTIADFSPQTQQALNLTEQRAVNGSPVSNASQDYTTGLLRGDYLNSNPYLDKMFDTAANKVESRVNSAFGGGGRFGGGLNQKALSDSLGDLAGNIYGGNYQNERQLQQGGLAYAPSIANQDFANLQALSGVGQTYDTQNQNKINENINRFNANQQAPLANIQSYIDLLNGTGGQYKTGSTTTPYYTNPLGNALGTGLLGAGAVSSLLPSSFNLGALLTAGLPWSDVRKKEDITYAGIENGHEVFNFRYIDYPELGYFKGVMAQKVMKTNPEAVVMGEDGFYRVNYDKIGVEFKQLLN